jgi:crotonobetainyl-CoA:carnitine CoA-transferase CaiB-like acyl-CoA transferase
MSKPLHGIQVLDLSRILAGPWCTQALADLGAQVIKVERPGVGDDTRTWGPPYLRDTAGVDTSETAYYLSCNRGKQSVCIDIATAAGQEQVRALAKTADVVVENYKVGQLRKYGLDYESLSRVNPRLIYCSITGFGQTGPYAHRAGYDYVIQGLSGFMSITGEREGTPGAEPQKAGTAITDLFTGVYSALAISSALHKREREGCGSYIDMALLDVGVSVMANMGSNYLTSGKVPTRAGNAHANLVPYQVFECADGHLIIAVGNDSQFRKFCSVLRCDELADDPRYSTNPARVRHRDSLVPLLALALKQRSRREWIALLHAANVPCGPINTIADALADEQVRHRGMRIDLPHPLAGSVPLLRSPIMIDGEAMHANTAPPLLGEHQHLL